MLKCLNSAQPRDKMLALNVPANHSYVQDYDLTVIYGGGGDGGGASDEKAAEPVTCVLSI